MKSIFSLESTSSIEATPFFRSSERSMNDQRQILFTKNLIRSGPDISLPPRTLSRYLLKKCGGKTKELPPLGSRNAQKRPSGLSKTQ